MPEETGNMNRSIFQLICKFHRADLRVTKRESVQPAMDRESFVVSLMRQEVCHCPSRIPLSRVTLLPTSHTCIVGSEDYD